MRPIVNHYPVDPRRKYVRRARMRVGPTVLLVSGVVLGLLLGSPGILIAIVMGALADAVTDLVAKRTWDRRHTKPADGLADTRL